MGDSLDLLYLGHDLLLISLWWLYLGFASYRETVRTSHNISRWIERRGISTAERLILIIFSVRWVKFLRDIKIQFIIFSSNILSHRLWIVLIIEIYFSTWFSTLNRGHCIPPRDFLTLFTSKVGFEITEQLFIGESLWSSMVSVKIRIPLLH